MTAQLARRRLQLLRERRGISQEEMARALGFKDRQTLSAIELGERQIQPAELVAAAQFFQVEIDFFTDPFELAGEGRFSWRQSGSSVAELDRVEAQAGRWLAAFRYFSKLKGERFHSLQLRVAIGPGSAYEDAAAEGEAIAAELGLGLVPARELARVLEDDLGTLVLYMEPAAGISGAACRLSELNAILINRRDPPARQAFDLAHELFHLLTWDVMPPGRRDGQSSAGAKNRVERLAENFAAGLLVPRPAVERLLREDPLGQPRNKEAWASWLASSAEQLEVSAPALKWRLVNLGLLKKAEAERISDEDLRKHRPSRPAGSLPPRFSRRFVELLGWGLEQGHASVRRMASVLGFTVDDLAALFREHQLEPPFDL